MTTLDAIARFDLLIDKTGSPYFTTDEKLTFLNLAQLEVLNRMVPDTLGGVANFELDQNTYMNLLPLTQRYDITPTPATSSDVSLISISTINGLIGGGNRLFRLLDVAIVTSATPFRMVPIKYVKQNVLSTNLSNTFKRPTSTSPFYTIDSSSLYIVPKLTTFARINLIRTPSLMTAVNSPDWDDYVMNQVIQVAVELATVATRDKEGLDLITNTTVQSK